MVSRDPTSADYRSLPSLPIMVVLAGLGRGKWCRDLLSLHPSGWSLFGSEDEEVIDMLRERLYKAALTLASATARS